MRKFLGGLIILLLGNYHVARATTPEEILKQVDKNFNFSTVEMVSELKVYEGNRMVIYQKIHSFAKGKDTSFAAVLAPARDAGTKFLKIGSLMWMYLPGADRVIKISGHLLRQSMLGSDFSYEDAMEGSKSYRENYNIEGFSSTRLGGRDCYKLVLIARSRKTTYYKRILWIDKKTFIPLREEWYSRQGKLLKILEVIETKKFGDRFYPVRATLKNVLRKNTYTEMNIISAKFNVELPENIFTRASLSE